MFSTLCMHVAQAWGLLSEKLVYSEIKNTSVFFSGLFKNTSIVKCSFLCYGDWLTPLWSTAGFKFSFKHILIISYFDLELFHWAMR